MDDRRFDSLAKSLATGASRRSLFKGLLGLGGAAAVGGVLRDDGVEAARRPTPTPKPLVCPYPKVKSGNTCVCPSSSPDVCGPDCCSESVAFPNTAAYSECCDNACCFGHCYGEELCCQYPNVFCEAQNECCFPGMNQCCGSMGCCDHECCPVGEGGGACCEAPNSKCCAGDACIPADGCCSDDECAGGCQRCVGHVCTDVRANCPGGDAGCYDCVGGACQANVGYCNDNDPCTNDVCSDTGSCSNPFYCTSNDCCNDYNDCTQNICDTSTGQCSFPPYCTSNGCCPDGQECDTSNGQCYTPCDELGDQCESGSCCEDLHCYPLIVGALSVCGPCLPDGAPCIPGATCLGCCNYALGAFCSPVEVCLPEDAPCFFVDELCCSNSCTLGLAGPTCD